MFKVLDTRSRCIPHTYDTHKERVPRKAQKQLRQKATDDACHETAMATHTRKTEYGTIDQGSGGQGEGAQRSWGMRLW
jgi:hypothetical protein